MLVDGRSMWCFHGIQGDMYHYIHYQMFTTWIDVIPLWIQTIYVTFKLYIDECTDGCHILNNTPETSVSFHNHVWIQSMGTWRGSCAVVACVRICGDLRTSITTKRIFHRIWIASKKPLVKQAPAKYWLSWNMRLIRVCVPCALSQPYNPPLGKSKHGISLVNHVYVWTV